MMIGPPPDAEVIGRVPGFVGKYLLAN
jgi:hypothetical protein